MPRQLPPLNALRAFEAAGRHESFSRAADELSVSHSAISRHVRGLEDRLSTQLFRDLPRGVALTQAGQRYLAQLTPAFDLIAEASDALAEVPEGTLTINSEQLFAVRWLIPRLGDFYEKHPEIELRLDASRELINIERYEADIAIRYLAKGPPDAASILISNAPMYPFIAPDLMPEPFTHPRQLLKFRLYRDRSGEPWARWFALAGGVDPSEQPVPKWRLRTMLALEAAIAGHGVILVASDLVDADVKAGRLVKCFDVPLWEGSYHLLFGEGVMRRKPARIFRDWLIDQSTDFRFSDQSAPDNQPFG